MQYKCYPGFMDYDSVGYEGILAVIVAGREVMYVFTTLLGILICPSFLLLDPVTAWREGDGCGGGLLRAACYVLAPHNYVLLCIANRYRNWQKTFQVSQPHTSRGVKFLASPDSPDHSAICAQSSPHPHLILIPTSSSPHPP